MAKRYDPSNPKNASSVPNGALFLLMGGLFIAAVIGAAFLLGGTDLISAMQRPDPTPIRTAEDAAHSTPQTGQPPATATPTATDLLAPTATATPATVHTPVSTPATPATPPPVTPPVEITPTPPTQTGTVSGDVVNVRAGPGTNYPILGQVFLDQQIQIVGKNEDGSWLQICCPIPGQADVWMSGEYIETDGDLDTLVVVATPPPPAPVPAPQQAIGNNTTGPQAASLAQPAPGLPAPGGFGPPGDVNPLTGLRLPSERRNQRPLIVCINNDFAARPQYGTGQADVMVEYLMEGFSITRFSGIFYGNSAERIGPVRSARLINYHLGALYDAGTACSGASDRVRFLLRNDAPFPYLDIDLDDPSNTLYSFSIGSDYRTRLQTGTELLRKWLAAIGAERAPHIRGFTFGDVPAGGAPASIINIPYPQVTGSQVLYQYDATSGRYLRFLGGQPHLDGADGTQLALDNVIVQFAPHEITDIIEDSLGSRSIRINLFGSGKAILFRNGLAFEGSWRSDSQGDTPRFFDQNGQELPLKPGHTWISVVPLDYPIAYQ